MRSEKSPGELRRSQNWIGGTRPGNAISPPPLQVEDGMAALKHFIHEEHSPYPTLIKAALAHVQFETIHPFLDGNGRIGRLLIAFILQHGAALSKPLLYLSLCTSNSIVANTIGSSIRSDQKAIGKRGWISRGPNA